jgi:hypothetical protein
MDQYQPLNNDILDHPNQEYHCLMVGTDPLIEFVYNFQYDKWTVFERGTAISGAVTFQEDNQWIVLDFGEDGYVYELESGLTDNGAMIDYSIETKDLIFIEDGLLNFRGFLLAGSQNSFDVTVSYALDGATSYTTLITDIDMHKSNYNFALPDERMNVQGHSIRWKIESDTRMDLYKYFTFFTPLRGLREHPDN